MSIAEIEKTKLELIDWVRGLSDGPMLDNLLSLKYSQESSFNWDALPEAHRKSIMAGVKQVANGEGLSSEEFWQTLKRK